MKYIILPYLSYWCTYQIWRVHVLLVLPLLDNVKSVLVLFSTRCVRYSLIERVVTLLPWFSSVRLSVYLSVRLGQACIVIKRCTIHNVINLLRYWANSPPLLNHYFRKWELFLIAENLRISCPTYGIYFSVIISWYPTSWLSHFGTFRISLLICFYFPVGQFLLLFVRVCFRTRLCEWVTVWVSEWVSE